MSAIKIEYQFADVYEVNQGLYFLFCVDYPFCFKRMFFK